MDIVYCTHKTQKKHTKNFKNTNEATLTQTNCPRREIDMKQTENKPLFKFVNIQTILTCTLYISKITKSSEKLHIVVQKHIQLCHNAVMDGDSVK